MSTCHALIGNANDEHALALVVYEQSNRFSLDLLLPEDLDVDDGEIVIQSFGDDPQALVRLAHRLIQIASYYDSSIKDPLL